MANYVILCVDSSKAVFAEKWFALAEEKESDLLKLEYSCKNACYYFANKGKLDKGNDGGVFKGYAIDHIREHVIFSGTPHAPNVNWALPGCYIRLQKEADDVIVGNDLFAQLPMLYFMTNGIIAISDSVFILTRLRRFFGLTNSVNFDAALSRVWIHGMGSQLLGISTLIDGISFCPPGTKIRIRFMGDNLSAQIEKILVPDLFFNHMNDYRETLLEGARRIASLVATMPRIPESHTTVDVSGGTDSRLMLAAALMQPDPKIFTFLTSKTQLKDYAVAQQLAKRFKFTYGSMKAAKKVFSGQLPNWFLSSAGIYDPLQAPSSAPLETTISIGGQGAEVYKGNFLWRSLSAMTPDKVGHAAEIQRYVENSALALAPRKHFLVKRFNKYIGRLEPKVGIKISDAVYREASKGLHSVGICPENPWASEWHYLCFRNAIHSGRSTMRSLLGVRPILQRELVNLSYSKLNYYPAPKNGSPSIVTDLLIALNPDLAMMPFDDPNKNLAASYVSERSRFLGRVNQNEPYSIIGEPKSVNSGTPAFFLKLVSTRWFEGNFSPDAIKKLAIDGYDSIPETIKSDYELPRLIIQNELPSRITGSSWHCTAAGKLMAFLLID